MRKVTESVRITVIVALALVISSTLTAASEVVGEVADQNHNFVNGVQVVATDQQGNKAGDGQTDLYGRYCVRLTNPGNYTISVDPGQGLHGGSIPTTVGAEGLVADWTLSQAAPAQSSTKPGNASPATATCGAVILGAANPDLVTAAGVVLATGAGLGACAGAGCFSGKSGGPPASASK